MQRKLNALLWVGLLLPFFAGAQHLTEYRPAMNLFATSVVNLESLRGTNPTDPVAGYTRSVNTFQEAAASANTDIWYLTSDAAGLVVNSIHYGIAGTNERASAIEQCPNGDYIILGIVTIGNFDRILAFRISAAGGAPIWVNTYSTANFHTRGYCIKKTNDAAESYMIAGTNSLNGGANADKTLLALKINANGGMIWNNAYVDPVMNNNIFDVPRSMLVVGNIHYIAGNRTQANARDVFAIGIDQAAGAIAVPYRYVNNNNLVDQNPYINVRNGGGFVLVYSTTANIAAVNTPRVAFTPLTAALVPAANTTLYWEANTTNNYGHTIYPAPGGANYDIGGGTTLSTGVQNPTFFTITNAGAIVAGSYRRIWDVQNYTSTFMLRDPRTAPPAANGYAHHNYRPTTTPNGMSVYRNSAMCNYLPVLSSQTVVNNSVTRALQIGHPLIEDAFNQMNAPVTGMYFNCAGGSGNFRKPATSGIEEIVAGNSFRVYPTLVVAQSHVNMEMEALQAAPATINIYNMEAKLVQRRPENLLKGSNILTIPVNGLPAGTYIIELKAGGETQKARFVKQ